MTSNGKSHQEIWDDSLLVNSWNEALEEYKYYHSIHARGEKVEAILKEAENQSERESVPHRSDGTEPLELSSSEQVGGEAAHQPGNDQHAKNDLPPRPVLSQAHHSTPDKGPALPQHLIGQGETNKKAYEAFASVANVGS